MREMCSAEPIISRLVSSRVALLTTIAQSSMSKALRKWSTNWRLHLQNVVEQASLELRNSDGIGSATKQASSR